MHGVFQGIINSSEYNNELWSENCTRIARRKGFRYTCKVKYGKIVKYWLFIINKAAGHLEHVFHMEYNAVVNLMIGFICMSVF